MAKLEAEEEEREKEGFYELNYDESDDEMKEVHRLATKIKEKIIINRINNSIDKPRKGKAVIARASRPRERSVTRLKAQFSELGVDMTETDSCNFSHKSSLSRPAPKKFRSATSVPRPRSLSTPRDEMGVKNPQVLYHIIFIYCDCHVKSLLYVEEVEVISFPFQSDLHVLISFPIYRRLTQSRNAYGNQYTGARTPSRENLIAISST